MEYIARVSDVVPGLRNENFTLHLPPDGVDSTFGGTTASV